MQNTGRLCPAFEPKERDRIKAAKKTEKLAAKEAKKRPSMEEDQTQETAQK